MGAARWPRQHPRRALPPAELSLYLFSPGRVYLDSRGKDTAQEPACDGVFDPLPGEPPGDCTHVWASRASGDIFCMGSHLLLTRGTTCVTFTALLFLWTASLLKKMQ